MADSETTIPLGWQSFYMVSMFSGTFISYITPILLIRRQQQQKSSSSLVANQSITGRQTYRVLSMCNCLSAGLFLGICFLNLIPYVQQEFDEIFRSAKYETDFPVGMCSVIAGLFLVLTLETLVMKFRGESEVPVLQLDEEEDSIHDSLHSEQRQELLEPTNSDKESNEFVVKKTADRANGHSSHSHHMHSHSHSHDLNPNAFSSNVSFFILMFATSVHSVFEGLALGIQKDATKALHLFIGIILHECLVSFALALNSARIECQLKTAIKFAVVFSLTIPIGIVMGVLLAYTPGLFGKSISGVFQGLAAGTFLHVTFHELIPSEFMSGDNHSSQKLFKIFLLFVGFTLMALITLITDSH